MLLRFLSLRIDDDLLTLRGVRQFFVIAFLHVGSRKVFVTPATEHPSAEWVKDASRSVLRIIARR